MAVTDVQFYLAMAIPTAMFLATTLVILWSARGVDKRIESLEKRFDSLVLDVRELRADIKLLTGKVYETIGEKRG